MGTAIAIACWLAAALAFLLVGVLLQTGGWARNALLVTILAVEGTLQVVMGAITLLGEGSEVGNRLFVVALACLAVLSSAYIVFIGRLDAPAARLARSPAFQIPFTAIILGGALVTALFVLLAWREGRSLTGEDDPLLLVVAVLAVFVGMLLASVLALVATVQAWRRAPKGTPARARASAFALAFGCRDALFVASLVVGEIDFASHALADLLEPVGELTLPLATLVFIPLLTYGILRTQLFDIDLKVKLGIKRSTAVTIALVVVLGAAKTAEFYLNKTYGLLAGGIAAGAMLVLTPRLNKMGDKVANTAMPQVQPTNAYVAFKKLEVYRAAVESANEVGMDEKQRAVLDRLRGKLGLSPADTDAVEAELRSQAAAA